MQKPEAIVGGLAFHYYNLFCVSFENVDSNPELGNPESMVFNHLTTKPGCT